MDHALLRGVAATFDHAIVRDGGRPPQVELARQQHDAYRRLLEQHDYSVAVIPADDRYPDCVFIEDTAVVVGEVALVTRPGAESRQGEGEAVAPVLAEYFEVLEMTGPGTLDGGDVMILGGTIWVGRSARSNDEGIALLGEVASSQGLEMIVVPVDSVLHLKSAVLPVDQETVVVTPGAIDESLLEGLRVLPEHPEECGRFSALPLGDGVVLVTASAPRSAATVSALGIETVPIDVSEILAADGGLTCMSILYET